MDPAIIETATVAMATFFATIGPLDVAAVYAGLTATETPKTRVTTCMPVTPKNC